MEMYGIDISKYQGSNVDFNKVKAAGKKFVLIKAGYGKYLSQKEPTFETHYKGAKTAGLHVGAYWYSYAHSKTEAIQEANICLEIIKGKQFDMPIYFDFEEKSQFALGKTTCSEIVKAFCDTLESAGYFAGLYIYRSALQSYITPEVIERYALAVAEYNDKLNYSGPVGMWQYKGDAGRCEGVNGPCDLDVCYVDYPAIIKEKGLNGYTKSTPSIPAENKPKPTLKSNQEIAKEVIQGDWSNGEKRKQLLTEAGYDYTAVQAIVNSMLGSSPTGSRKSVDELAREVIQGKWGNGNDRKNRLTNAGYDYNVVQKRVNELLKG